MTLPGFFCAFRCRGALNFRDNLPSLSSPPERATKAGAKDQDFRLRTPTPECGLPNSWNFLTHLTEVEVFKEISFEGVSDKEGCFRLQIDICAPC